MTMRKIKGFKIALRPKELLRRAKKAGLDLEAWDFAVYQPAYGARPRELVSTPEFQGALNGALGAMQTAVLFDSYAAASGEAPAAPELAPLPGPAYSLILVTLGRTFMDHKARVLAANPAQSALWALIEEAALEDAVRFATSLLEQEAAQEGLELSPLSFLTGSKALGMVLEKLPGSKIGLSLAGEFLDPPASRAVSLSWLAKARKKLSK